MAGPEKLRPPHAHTPAFSRPAVRGTIQGSTPGGIVGAGTARAVNPFSDLNFNRGVRSDLAAMGVRRRRTRVSNPTGGPLPPESQLQPTAKPKKRGMYL